VSAQYHLTTKIPVHLPGPSPIPHAMQPPPAMPAEILTHDWNKYRDTVIATGGVDRAIRTFDIRNPSAGPASVMLGHDYAVRRLAWSPHASDILVSASYDMTVRLWTDGSTMGSSSPGQQQDLRPGVQLGVMNRHTEFATGVDWCLFGVGGWVATVGWDERVLLWDANMMLQGRG
jgi:peroxin-7